MTLSTLSISYEISPELTADLGADARSVWTDALTTELEARFPGCGVDVTTRWSSVDADRYDVTGETTDGAAIAGGKRYLGVDIYDGAVDEYVPVETLRLIADRINAAVNAAWERACMSVE